MSRLTAYILAAVVALGLLGIGVWTIYHAGQKSVQVKWDAEKARVEADYQRRLAAVTADRDKTVNALAENQSSLLELRGRLAVASKQKTLTRTVIREVAVNVPVNSPVNSPCACPVLDSEFSRLFNAARTPSSPAPAR